MLNEQVGKLKTTKSSQIVSNKIAEKHLDLQLFGSLNKDCRTVALCGRHVEKIAQARAQRDLEK